MYRETFNAGWYLMKLLLCVSQAEGAEGSLAKGETDWKVAWSYGDPSPQHGRGERPRNFYLKKILFINE